MKYFPLSEAGQKSVQHLVAAIIIYLLCIWLANILMSITGWIVLVRKIIGIVLTVFKCYCTVGIILAVLKWFKLVK